MILDQNYDTTSSQRSELIWLTTSTASSFPFRVIGSDEYARVARAVAGVWKEYGALDYLEFVGDDMNRAGTRSFTDLVAATDDEAIVFGWVVLRVSRGA